MTGLDTNVLVRYIVQDDPRQSRLAEEFIERSCDETTPGFISQIVLCELVWVLRRSYGYSKEIISQVLRQILSTKELRVEQSSCVWRAVKAFESGGADFSDYLLGAFHQQEGCRFTVTFDEKAARSDLFSLLT